MRSYLVFLFVLFFSLLSIDSDAQCSGSLSVSATTVLPGTTINASATGWMDDYEWYAEGGTSPQITWNGNDSWSTSFPNPGVYHLCVAMTCDNWGTEETQVECVTITVTNPDGSPPDNENYCGSEQENPADLIGDAPMVCSFEDYCASTIDFCGPDGSCSPDDGINPTGIGSWTIENNSWIQFVASSTTACFDLNINCIPSSGVGIQMAIVEWNGSGGTGGFTQVDNANATSGMTALTGNQTMCANGLTIGNTYYLTVDGHDNSLCNYTINATSGIQPGTDIDATINGTESITICENDLPTNINLDATGGDGSTYNWTLNGNPVGSGIPLSATVPAGSSGTLTYIVQSISGGTSPCDPPAGTLIYDEVYVNITPPTPIFSNL